MNYNRNKVLFLIIFFQFISDSLSLSFIFDNKTDLISQLSLFSLDTNVMILYKLQSALQTSHPLSIRDLYFMNNQELISQIEEILPLSITNETFNEYIRPYPENYTVIDIIKSAPWEFLVKWNIYYEKYLIKKEILTPSFGGIETYVSYMNEKELKNILLEGIGVHQELNDADVFENNIMNLHEIDKITIVYFYQIINSGNYLKQIYINFIRYMIRKGFIQKNCTEIEEILEQDSNEIFEYLFKLFVIYPEINELKDTSLFMSIIEYNNHTFPTYELDVKSITENQQLRNYAKYAERIHRMSLRSLNSFKHLDEYISKIESSQLQMYIISMIKNHHELALLDRINDLEYSLRSVTMSSLLQLLNYLTHEELLRWYLNIKQMEFTRNKLYSSIDIETITDNVYYKSDIELKNDIIQIIKKYPEIFTSVEVIIQYAEPTNSLEGQFRRYFNSFPPIILNRWLKQIIMYDYNRTNILRITEDPYSFKKEESINAIMSLMNIHNELFNLEKFGNEIDVSDSYTNLYGGYPDMINAHSIRDLRKFVLMLSKKYRAFTKSENINGGQFIPFTNKTDIIDKIMMYIESHSNIYRQVHHFDVIVGLSELHSYIHFKTIEELKAIAKKLQLYYNLKIYKIKRYNEKFAVKTFDEWLLIESDESKIKRYIFKIMAIFPELNIESVLIEVINLYDFKEKYTYSEFKKVLNDLIENKDNDTLFDLTYRFIRYSNETLPTRYKRDINVESSTRAYLQYYIEELFNVSITLNTNYNLAKLVYGFDYLLYGGVMPFIIRLSNTKLIELFNEITNSYKEIKIDNFESLSHNMKITILYNIIEQHREYKDINKLKSILTFKKIENVTKNSISFNNISKQSLISYSLVVEKFIRDKGLLNQYGSIYRYVQDITREEIEDYIANGYDVIKEKIKSLEDFELYSNINYFHTTESYLM